MNVMPTPLLTDTPLPLHGNGHYRYVLSYFAWRADLLVPVFADCGTLPYFLTKRDAEVAAKEHDLPWHRLAVLGFSRASWEAFYAKQAEVEAYRPGLAFDVARVEARDGVVRKPDKRHTIMI